MLLLATYPKAAEDYIRKEAPYLPKDMVVMDCLGTKRPICAAAFPLAEEYGFTFVGGHPMAGTHHSGFKYARENLFHGAPMVLVPPAHFDMELLERVKTLLAPLGFGSFAVTTAEQHDEVIAFTSMEYTKAVDAVHPSGLKLYEMVDLALDNCAPAAEAMLDVEGIEAKYAAASGIASNLIMWSMTSVAVEKLMEKGITPGILKSANFPGGADYNHTVVEPNYQKHGW